VDGDDSVHDGAWGGSIRQQQAETNEARVLEFQKMKKKEWEWG
jgi:hypothetical protein